MTVTPAAVPALLVPAVDVPVQPLAALVHCDAGAAPGNDKFTGSAQNSQVGPAV